MEKKIREKTVEEVIALAVYKISKLSQSGGGVGKAVSVYIPPPYLPPCKPYKVHRVETEYGEVKLFVRTSKNGGWVVDVKFCQPLIFNPVIRREEAEKLKEKLKK
jgi:hypothetical protein